VIIQKQHALTDIPYFKQLERYPIYLCFGWHTLDISIHRVLHLANQSQDFCNSIPTLFACC